MTTGERRSFSAEMKARIELELIKGVRPLRLPRGRESLSRTCFTYADQIEKLPTGLRPERQEVGIRIRSIFRYRFADIVCGCPLQNLVEIDSVNTRRVETED